MDSWGILWVMDSWGHGAPQRSLHQGKKRCRVTSSSHLTLSIHSSSRVFYDQFFNLADVFTIQWKLSQLRTTVYADLSQTLKRQSIAVDAPQIKQMIQVHQEF